MKRILTSVVPLVLLFPTLGLGETMDDLVEREGVHYKKFSLVPFTGKIMGGTQGAFRNGKKHGPWVVFWSNGQLKFNHTYKDGKLGGPFVSFLSNGRILSKSTYKNGKWISD